MNKLFVLILSISASILFSSCEGGTTFTKSIDNRSTETIQVMLKSIYGNSEETTILPNESKQIFWDDQMGFFVDDSYTCTQLIDSIKLTITNNKVLTKDIMDPENWTRNSTNGRNSREDCLFTLTNNDLQ